MREEIKSRTKKIALAIISLTVELPHQPSSYIVAKQIIRSSTSIGANYRAACRAKSNADFIYKLKIVEEEADETMYWLEILEDSKIVLSEHILPIKNETNEILAIIVATIKTLRNKETQHS